MMKIWTAWVETESGFDLVAAATDDDYSGGYSDIELERKSFDYDMEPRVLCLDVEDSFIGELVAGGDTEGSLHPQP